MAPDNKLEIRVSFHAIRMAFVFLLLVIFMIGHIVAQGASTSAPADRAFSPSPSPSLSVEQRISGLEGQIGNPRPKDRWDKLSAISGLLAAVATGSIAALGIYATYRYNRRQQDIQHTQVVQSLLDPLFSRAEGQSDDAEKTKSLAAPGEDMFTAQEGNRLDIALRAMALVNPKFVVRVAAMLERGNVLSQMEALAKVGVLSLTSKTLAQARLALRINKLARNLHAQPAQVMATLIRIVEQRRHSPGFSGVVITVEIRR